MEKYAVVGVVLLLLLLSVRAAEEDEDAEEEEENESRCCGWDRAVAQQRHLLVRPTSGKRDGSRIQLLVVVVDLRRRAVDNGCMFLHRVFILRSFCVCNLHS